MSEWLWLNPHPLHSDLSQFASRAFRLRRLMATLPTSKLQGFHRLGRSQRQAKVTHDVPRRDRRTCSQWSVEEEWKKTEVDSDGKTRTSSGWKTVASGGVITSFIEDDTGALRVNPEGAELTQNLSFGYSCRRQRPTGKGLRAISNSTGHRRFREHTIQVNDALVMGQARVRGVVAPECGGSRHGKPLHYHGKAKNSWLAVRFGKVRSWGSCHRPSALTHPDRRRPRVLP